MSRDAHDAHYLHAQHGLSVLVRPPVEGALMLAWDGRKNLLAATDEGEVVRVNPAMGTRILLDGLERPLGMGVDGDRFVLVEAGGRWTTYDVDGTAIIEAEHPFVGPVKVQFREGKVLLTGLTRGEKQVLFYDSGRKVLRIQIPSRAVGFISSGHFGLAQSTPVGLETIYLRDGGRFHGREHTIHQLHAHRDHIVGVHGSGIRVWSLVEGEHMDVSMPGTVMAALSHDGRLAAIGTAGGHVALVDLEDPSSRKDPLVVEAADEPVRTLAFARSGAYLATGADELIIWSWG